MSKIEKLNKQMTVLCIVAGVVMIVSGLTQLSFLSSCPEEITNFTDYAESIFLACVCARCITLFAEVKKLKQALAQTERKPIEPEVSK